MTAPNGNSALSTCSFSSLPSEQELEFQEERSSAAWSAMKVLLVHLLIHHNWCDDRTR